MLEDRYCFELVFGILMIPKIWKNFYSLRLAKTAFKGSASKLVLNGVRSLWVVALIAFEMENKQKKGHLIFKLITS